MRDRPQLSINRLRVFRDQLIIFLMGIDNETEVRQIIGKVSVLYKVVMTASISRMHTYYSYYLVLLILAFIKSLINKTNYM